MEEHEAHPWRSVEELVEIGYQRSRVVIMNECHAGWFRCTRTRRIGQRLLPTVHQLRVRHLAMEALYPSVVEEANRTRYLPADAWGYLAQPEMRTFIQAALDLEWTLVAYEADMAQEPPGLSERQRNIWREEQQAHHLVEAFSILPNEGKLFVWCGNNHHTKAVVPSRPEELDEPWALMGYHFRAISGIDPFVIDQGVTVQWPGLPGRRRRWLEEITPTLTALGGTAGFLTEEAPACLPVAPGNDAYVASLDNAMEEWRPAEDR